MNRTKHPRPKRFERSRPTERIESKTSHFRPGVHRARGKPAITRAGVSTNPATLSPPRRAPSASACEPYREIIAERLARGGNAMAIWQDWSTTTGFVHAMRVPAACSWPTRQRADGRAREATKKAGGSSARAAAGAAGPNER